MSDNGTAATEQLLIGASLHAPERAIDAIARVTSSDFLDRDARDVWAVIEELTRAGRLPDVGAVRSMGASTEFLAECINRAGTPTNLSLYAERVADAAAVRRVADLGVTLRGIAGNAENGSAASIEAQTAWTHYCERGATGADYTDFAALLSTSLEATHQRRVAAPLNELDNVCDGLPAEGLVIVAGRPGMGKSSLITSRILSLCEISPGDPGIIFSMEMSRVDVVASMLSASAEVPLSRLPSRSRGEDLTLSDEHYGRISTAQTALAGSKVDIHDNPTLTMAGMTTEILRSLRRHERERPSFVSIDHLGLISPGNPRASTYERTCELSRDAKVLSRRFKCPVFLLAQLNRAVEQRDNKRPRLSDLRDSGSIEQDADVVLLLFRPSYYDEQTEDLDEIIVAKNRAGPTGSAFCRFTPEVVRWD